MSIPGVLESQDWRLGESEDTGFFPEIVQKLFNVRAGMMINKKRQDDLVDGIKT
jgi:hypothetical protein